MPKKAYVGVVTDVPIYEEKDGTVNITADNLANYFSVENGKYCFAWNGSGWVSNNGGVADSSATTVLTALQDLPSLSFGYYYSSEKSFDKFTLKVGGNTIENGASGSKTNKTWSGSLAKGKTIELTYTKDSSGDSYDDKCALYSLTFTGKAMIQVGSEKKSVAREVKSIYVGVNGPVPVYTTDATVAVNGGNLTNYFSQELESGSALYASASSTYFYGSSSVVMTLYARYDMDVSFTTGYNCGDYSGMSLDVYAKGETAFSRAGRNNVSGKWSGHLKANQAIRLEFDQGEAPDEEDNDDLDRPTVFIQDIVLTNVTRQTGTETKDAARAVKKAYIGVNGIARLFFERSVDALDIVYTGRYTDKVVTMDDKQYRLLTLISSGKLILPEAVTADIWMCGGGTSGGPGIYVGSSYARGSGGGGGGGSYFKRYPSHTLTAGKHTAIIGAGGSNYSTSRDSGDKESSYKGAYVGGGTSSLDDLTHTELPGGKVSARAGISGASGGGAGYAYASGAQGAYAASGGTGGGNSTIPFGSTFFEPHCSGGTGGGECLYDSTDDDDDGRYDNGQYGGTNGADGESFARGDQIGYSSSMRESPSIYGSGGRGGWASTDNAEKNTSSASAGGSGVQGVIYIRIPI